MKVVVAGLNSASSHVRDLIVDCKLPKFLTLHALVYLCDAILAGNRVNSGLLESTSLSIFRLHSVKGLDCHLIDALLVEVSTTLPDASDRSLGFLAYAAYLSMRLLLTYLLDEWS